jgi:D-amino peptidase
MKIVIMTDMEGVSGVVSFEDQGYPTGKYHEQAKKLCTAEINAAVEGLVAEGVDDILVIDGHGPGAVSFEDLHPAAKLAYGRSGTVTKLWKEIVSEYDATIMIGQHAMAGTEGGTLNHTQNSRGVDYYKLNGRYIGEIAQWALYCGGLGVPLIFLSGDEAAGREAEELIPGMTTATVKIGLGRLYAISFSQQEAHSRIREGVKEALKKQKEKPLPPLAWKGPFILEKRFMITELTDSTLGRPEYERVDSQTVRIKSDNILDIIYR